MNIPKTIRIGAITYTVEFCAPDEMDNNFGLVLYSTNEIKLSTTLRGAGIDAVFWHEVFHVVLEQSGHAKLKNNEGLMDALGYGFAAFMKANPKVFKE